MTESENGLLDGSRAPESGASPDQRSGRRAGVARRTLEWFWGGAAMKAIVGAEPVQIARELRRRAELALELGQLAAEKIFENGSSVPIACELNRQAVYWALLASVSPSPGDGAPAILDEPAGVSRPTFAELWNRADRALLARAIGGEERVEALGSLVSDSSFVTLAELDAPACQLLASTLRQVARKLIREIDTAGREVDRVWVRRFLRIGGLALLLALLVAIPLVVSSRLEERRDLARGKAWTASSSLGDVGCTSPLQVCAASPDYFFHTLEEDNPSLTIDLGAKQTISAVRVKNRADCCADRAVPLIVETSLDDKNWQRVARRTEEFTDWKAKFAPTTARFVRLKVPRRTLLHLQAVRVLP
jgi:hypothetical protein